ncbi:MULTISPECIES: NAD(P)/FAD-dependent oxidoreductase [unclassified Aureimonas]|uniref:NAD(P)/FAD-dependent oxidoreductase n=1 Tax=unclassified Aureimonas TaxID=2615206 RepID=UPI0009E8902A|nr:MULTISPECIES: NAD(P)/FAD-dependent oxidoreductase [unclassified Aureimonas]
MQTFDTIVLGAGAAGMMAAAEAGRRGRSVLVVDHAKAAGEKIRISGGGRCNFTNTGTNPKRFLSQNPAFCISALKRYTAEDFVGLVERHGIAYHEKTLGQLFCDGSSRQIVDMLLAEMRQGGAELALGTAIGGIERNEDGFVVALSGQREGRVLGRSLIVATGGKSIPKMGATGIGYEIARQFGLRLTETRPALVPLTLDPASLEALTPLSGVAVDAEVAHGKTRFPEALLFTHRGLSGPAMLQISSYWREGDEIAVRLRPDIDAMAVLKSARAANGRQAVQTALSAILPKRLAQTVAERAAGAAPARTLAEHSDKQLARVAAAVSDWRFRPAGSEGYRTAEVTLGGVDTRDLDGRTMQAKTVPGLFFVGEVVDVTGWLGGYNFQWAWSSGWCAGQAA